MKAAVTNMKKVFTTLTVLVLMSTAIFAQNRNAELSFGKNGVANLRMAIESENPGLRKSAIYFAGKYQLEALVETLMKELENEDNAEMKYLISVTLYKIGKENGIYKVKELSETDTNPKVRRLAEAIVNQYALEKAGTFAGQ